MISDKLLWYRIAIEWSIIIVRCRLIKIYNDILWHIVCVDFGLLVLGFFMVFYGIFYYPRKKKPTYFIHNYVAKLAEWNHVFLCFFSKFLSIYL
jgi:hypothetical protein